MTELSCPYCQHKQEASPEDCVGCEECGGTFPFEDGFAPITITELADLLRSTSFNFTNELELQNGIEAALFKKRPDLPLEREAQLNQHDRIDFLIGDIGIEVKVDGSRNEVARQLHRYSQCEQISGLVLVTSRSRHLMPATLNNKPVRVVSLVLSGAF